LILKAYLQTIKAIVKKVSPVVVEINKLVKMFEMAWANNEYLPCQLHSLLKKLAGDFKNNKCKNRELEKCVY